MVDLVNHPPHYTHGGVEVIEFTRHMNFDIGNAVKYMARYKHKGNPKQDLEKALWYLDDYIKNYGRVYRVPGRSYWNLRKFILDMPPETDRVGIDTIMMDILEGRIYTARNLLEDFIAKNFA